MTTTDFIQSETALLRAWQHSGTGEDYRTFRAQRVAASTNHETEETEMDQGTFWRWLKDGVDGEASGKTEEERTALLKQAQAVMQMAQVACKQPAIGDQIHAVQRVQQMAETMAKAAGALAAEMMEGES